MRLVIKTWVDQEKDVLRSTVWGGEAGLKKKFSCPEAHRPGLALAGYLEQYKGQRILVLGREEIAYLKQLSASVRQERIAGVFRLGAPAVFVAAKLMPPKELLALCDEREVPLLRSSLPTVSLLHKIQASLNDLFAPSMSCHGTFVSVFGLGVLIQGDSAVGKSEAALGLIERGHRFICDDVVKLRLREHALEGRGAALARHLIEIRGIGIVNVAHLYGARSVQENKSVDLIVKLEEWDDHSFYDRVGLDEKFQELLGVQVPHHVLPVKPGRDVALLIEALVLNQRLKRMGQNSAQELNHRLCSLLSGKSAACQTQEGCGQTHT